MPPKYTHQPIRVIVCINITTRCAACIKNYLLQPAALAALLARQKGGREKCEGGKAGEETIAGIEFQMKK